MRKIVIGVMIALSVMTFSFAAADKLAQGIGGWLGPVVFLAVNCAGLYCAYKFIIWYSKNTGAVRPEKEDNGVATLIRNKKGNRGKPNTDQ